MIEGDVDERIARGRPRAEYTTRIMKDTNDKKYEDLEESCYNRELQQTNLRIFN